MRSGPDWDAKYDRDGFLFGTEPSSFLTAHAGLVPQGARVLCVAEGEGRNAAWLAAQGCRVTGFDLSSVGIQKARQLAAMRGVSVDLHVSRLEDWDWDRPVDLVVAVFIHLPPDLRASLFDGIRRALAGGGRVMLHGYAPAQAGRGTGGPADPALMYSEETLRAGFPDYTVLRLAAYEADLAEGTAHVGRSALIDFIADAPG